MSMFTQEIQVSTQEIQVPTKEVSVQEQNQLAMTNFSVQMAEAGFDGLDLTGMSFDRIKLHEGTFKLGTEEVMLGSEFDCVVHGTRRLYVVRQHAGQDAKTFYSYDAKGATTVDGSSTEEMFAEWADDGFEQPDIKEYLEAMVTLVNRDDEFEDQMVMLSIPPASRAKLSGAFAQAMQRLKATPDQVILKCLVGKQVGEGTKKFRPWAFKIVGLAK